MLLCFKSFYEYMHITQNELQEFEAEKPYEDEEQNLDRQYELTFEPGLAGDEQEDEGVNDSQPKQECPYSKTDSPNYQICSECGKCVEIDYTINLCNCRKEDKCREQNNSPPSKEVCPVQPPKNKICSECKKCVSSDSAIENCDCRFSEETIQDECECRKEDTCKEQGDRSQEVCPLEPPNYKTCSECGKCVTLDSTIDQCDSGSSEEIIRDKCECPKEVMCGTPVEVSIIKIVFPKV
uniref:Proprotein convertase subtilisin/kexin type 5-like n=1 Tax=Diabrotica virgifera virgifera TaxID=50390 RepID=A0A6P7GKC7_DIAVI